jgi:hypothetical protein
MKVVSIGRILVRPRTFLLGYTGVRSWGGRRGHLLIITVGRGARDGTCMKVVSIGRILVRPRTFIVMSSGTLRGASSRRPPDDIGAGKGC